MNLVCLTHTADQPLLKKTPSESPPNQETNEYDFWGANSTSVQNVNDLSVGKQ
jgi:hypothetical protein